MKPCSWCGNDFASKISYQIYCSVVCRDEATKIKIVERHKVLRRQKRKDKNRQCAGGCGTQLSIYNDDLMCNTCSINKKQLAKKFKEMKGMMHDYEDRR